jgi:AbrB family looped-hinge helix DNA binding protein
LRFDGGYDSIDSCPVNNVIGGNVEHGAKEEAWPIVIDSSGRVSVPAEARRTFGWDVGTRLVIERIDGIIRVISLDEFVERVQNHFTSKMGTDRSLVDELIHERRMEAQCEESRH